MTKCTLFGMNVNTGRRCGDDVTQAKDEDRKPRERKGKTLMGNAEEHAMMAVVESLNGMALTGWEIWGYEPGDGPSAILAVAHVGGEEIRCTLRPVDGYWDCRIETEDVTSAGFIIAGHVMTPEVAAGHVANARNGAA